jgi:hypothetical protein
MPAHDFDWHREAALSDRAVPDLMTALSGPDKSPAGAFQQPAQLAIERSRHSRGGHHRDRVDALGDNVQLDLVARRWETVFGRDLRRDLGTRATSSSKVRASVVSGSSSFEHHHTPVSPSQCAVISKALCKPTIPFPDYARLSEMVADGGE